MRELHKIDKRGSLVIITIADLHFGALDPKVQYEIIKEQFIDEINKLPLVDIISINGDLFDRRSMSDSDATLYASMFMADIRTVAINKNASVILISGTKQHDADQLKIFYHYLNDPSFDLRIVENIQFEYVKGARVLCIPELYNIPEEVYSNFLKYSGTYDLCMMHGTFEGAIYGNNAGLSRLFTIEDFGNCLGPISSGHVHVPGCLNRDFYYCGSPLRWKFGEEQTKGFMIFLYDMDTRYYYTHMIPIESFRYITVNIDHIIDSDPKVIIDYINNLKETQNIHYLRLEIKSDANADTMNIIKEYFHTNNTVKFKQEKAVKPNGVQNNDGTISSYDDYSYLFDPSLNEYDRLAKYINDREGSIIVNADTIKSILEEQI